MWGRGSGFGAVLGVPEFRALWAAELFSIFGDQLARVALAILVFQRTSSAALSALTYALTFVPAVIGGALLSGLADRYPRRRVLVATDLVRAALAATMAIPGLPLPAMWALVAVLALAGAPFKAAQQALLPQVLDGQRYLTGLSLRQVTTQGTQLVGYASGGLLLVVLEPHAALAANAATFLISAALIVNGVRPRPAPSDPERPADAEPEVATGRSSGQLLPIVVLVCLVSLFIVPGGVAAPYGAAIGAGSAGVGLLMAADPLGSVIGAWLLARSGTQPTRATTVALAVASGLPLLGCVFGPGLAVSVALCAASGALSTGYLILTQATVVRLVPDHRRGRIMGRIATALYSAQGLAILGCGLVTEVVGRFRAVAGAGLLGSMLALCVGIWWQRVARSRSDLPTGSERRARGNIHHSFSTINTSFQGDSDEGPKNHHSFSMKNTSSTRDESDDGPPNHHSFSTSDTSFPGHHKDFDSGQSVHHSFSTTHTSLPDRTENFDSGQTVHHSFSTTTPPSKETAETTPLLDHDQKDLGWPRNRQGDAGVTIMGVSMRDIRWLTDRGEDGSR
jgi:MFS family permease